MGTHNRIAYSHGFPTEKERNELPVRQSEKELQESITQRLALMGFAVIEYALDGGRPKCPRCGAWVGALWGTLKAGHPDVIAFAGDRFPERLRHQFIMFETKSRTGRLRESQRLFREWMAGFGIIVWQVKSWRDVENALKKMPRNGKPTLADLPNDVQRQMYAELAIGTMDAAKDIV